MIPVNRPNITEDDIEEVTRVLREGWVSGDAPEVALFETEFAEIHGCAFGVAVPNGSIAIELLLSVMGIGAGDEVILPTFSIISCLAPILRLGAKPIFVDADPHTWNMETGNVEALISPTTKLIMVVHTYGLPVNMAPLMALSKRYGIPLIEDAAESHGLKINDSSCGSFGIASTFSFYANKNVTTGEGGMICTNDEQLYERLKYFRNLTFRDSQRFIHTDLGWNYRFTAIQAALGRSQLRRLKDSIDQRRAIAQKYGAALQDVPGATIAPRKTPYALNDYWVVGIVLEKEKFGPASDVRRKLAESGLQTRPFFFPLHRQPVYLESPSYHSQDLPVADGLHRQGFYPPNGLGSSEKEINDSVQLLGNVLKNWQT